MIKIGTFNKMQDVKRNNEAERNSFNREKSKTGQRGLNVLFRDEALDELRQRHRELTMLNHKLTQELEGLLKEN